MRGRDGYKQTKHSVFIISPKGKVKEVIDKSDKEFTFMKEIMENNGYEF